jgi:hypothetical protein
MSFGEDVVVPITGILSVFVLSPLAIAYARSIWRRSSDRPAIRSVDIDLIARRLEELQQTVESMAIEVERISEGQRFVTKLMSQKPASALESGVSTPRD